MRSLIKYLLVNIGMLTAYIWPPSMSCRCRVLFDYINTGRLKNRFKYIGKDVCICKNVRIVGGSNIEIKENTYICQDCAITAFATEGDIKRTIIEIGPNCVLGAQNHITACNSIVIGEGLRTGKYVLISDNSHGNPRSKTDLMAHPDARPLFSKGGIIIGQNVWIGEGSSIMAGVTIGDGAVIGANSVMTHDVPAYSVVAGVPARII